MRRALAIAAILGGTLAPFAGSPYRSGDMDVARLAAAVEAEEDHVTAVELAQWIRDRKPGLRVLDLRTPAEIAKYRVPTSTHITLSKLVAAEFPHSDTIVLISDGGAHAAQAWVLMRARGYAHVYFLRGGLQEWIDTVAEPERPTELSRYFGGTRRDGC